jgi:hypothetical protein
MTHLDNWLERNYKTKRDEAMKEWWAIAAEAERLGYASHARDLAPFANSSTRSIRIRTGKLARFIQAVTQ